MPVLESLWEAKGRKPSSARAPEDVEREAFERGFAAGEKAGLELAEQKAAVLFEQLEQLLGELSAVKERLREELEPQLLLLALTVARKVIHSEVETRPEIIVDLIREGVKKLDGPGPLTVKISPALNEWLERKRPGWETQFPEVIFKADPKAPPGGAVVRSSSQEIRTDPDFLLAHLIESLRTPG